MVVLLYFSKICRSGLGTDTDLGSFSRTEPHGSVSNEGRHLKNPPQLLMHGMDEDREQHLTRRFSHEKHIVATRSEARRIALVRTETSVNAEGLDVRGARRQRYRRRYLERTTLRAVSRASS